MSNRKDSCWICRNLFTQEETEDKVAFIDSKAGGDWLEWLYAHPKCFYDKEPLTEQELTEARKERISQLRISQITNHYNELKKMGE